MKKEINKKLALGFTLLETLVVIAIVAIISSIVVLSIFSSGQTRGLEKEASMISVILEEARNNSAGVLNGSNYGVKIFSDRVVVFPAPNYVEGGANNKVYSLSDSSDYSITNISLANSSDTIIFKKINGGTDTYGSFRITLKSDTNQYKTIQISATGLISR